MTKFAQTPEGVLLDPDLSVGAKATYALLDFLAGKKGSCWPSEETLAKKLGVSRSSIKRYVGELRTRGYIKIESRGWKQTSRYTLSHRLSREDQKIYDFIQGGLCGPPVDINCPPVVPQVVRPWSTEPYNPPTGDLLNQRRKNANAPTVDPSSLALAEIHRAITHPEEKTLTIFVGQNSNLMQMMMWDRGHSIGYEPPEFWSLNQFTKLATIDALQKGGYAYVSDAVAFKEVSRIVGNQARVFQVGPLL